MEYIDTLDMPYNPVSELSQKLFLKFAFGVNIDKLPCNITEVSSASTFAEGHVPEGASSKVIDNNIDVDVVDDPVGETSSLKAAGTSAVTKVGVVPVGATSSLKDDVDSAPTNDGNKDISDTNVGDAGGKNQ